VVVGGLLAAAALVWLGRLLGEEEPWGGAWAVQALLTVAAVLAGVVLAVQHHRRWGRPTHALVDLLPRVRRGESPIEQLEDVGGGLKPLVPAVQDLLRELRQQRAATAELEQEIRQRVANRTDALERTIGTLRQQATRDALTGLFNRRFLDQYLPQCVQRHRKGRNDLCVLMMDVDNFKLLNDTLGHAAGDDLLRAIGQIIRSTIRGEDVGFRCGGDEFVVLLPGYGVEAGQALADRLVSLVDALGRTLRVAMPPRLAVGLATLEACAERTPHALLAEADRNLYDVKRARKSRRISQPTGVA
jgi:diguanylate cyclase (GGDEF)-like protein